MVNVNDKTILEHQISIFKKLGINDITVIIGPYPEQYDFEDISFIHDKKFMEHDILSSFMLASPIIDDDVIVSYGDVIFDENVLQPLIDFKDRIGLAIDFDWEQNYTKINKELKSRHNIIRKISSKYTIYCSPGHFVGFNSNLARNKKLEKYLFNHQIKKKFQYSLSWEKNQLAIWDNRSMLHQATPFKGNRIMHRITICLLSTSPSPRDS